MRLALFSIVVLFCFPVAARSQGPLDVPRYEAGLQFDFNYLDGVGEWGGGFGARFHYNFDSHFAFDSELLYRQHNVSAFSGATPALATVGQTTGLFGLRVGQRSGEVGFFAHARAGFLHFGTDNGQTLLTRTTVPAFDLGGTLEHYAGPVILRLDIGEMVVPYGHVAVSPGPFSVMPLPSLPLGTRASPSVGFGIAFRF